MTRQGPVRVFTSSGTDWVIEYIDPSGQRAKMNTKGPGFPEELTVQGNGETQYFMVYPNKYSDQANVTLFAENANDITVSHVQPPGFVSADDHATADHHKRGTSSGCIGDYCDRVDRNPLEEKITLFHQDVGNHIIQEPLL